jgi:hypothetical protein
MLTSHSLIHLATERVKDRPASLGMMYGQHVDSPALYAVFLDQDYRCKSLATHIPHDAEAVILPLSTVADIL